MYLNSVTLTGFLGGDAETRTTKNDITLTVFSVATRTPGEIRKAATGYPVQIGIAVWLSVDLPQPLP